MCKLFDVDVHSRKVHDLCSALGSDVNFMLFGGLGRLQGKGDGVTFSKLKTPLYFALTTFDESMNSGEIYSAFDDLANSQPSNTRKVLDATYNDRLLDLLQQGANGKAIPLLSNDLQQATLCVSNYARDYLNFMQSQQLHCNMTGSGSAYYVACLTKADAERVADLLNSHGFTTTVCTSIECGIELL